jgi:hypothetical protein
MRSRRSLVILAMLTVVALLAATTAALARPAPATTALAAPGTQWVYAIYMDGDNSLDTYWDQYSLPALLRIPAGEGVEIVAMMDRSGATGTQLVELEGVTQSLVAVYPEKDFGDGATFRWFIQEVRSRYPSGRLAVSVWDHGYGWRSFAADDTSGGDRITMDEFRSALADAGVTVDLLAFDCCNMANTEVAYEAARSGKVGILVASEETVPQNGYPYDLMLAPVTTDPTRTPAQVGADMVAGWKTYYDAQTWAPGAHLAAIDLARLESATADLQDWATLLRIDLAASRDGITAAASTSWFAWATDYADLGDLCRQLAADGGITDPALKAASRRVTADVAAALIAQDTGPASARATGLSVWWPSRDSWGTSEAAYYAQAAFAQPQPIGVAWWSFLDAYVR